MQKLSVAFPIPDSTLIIKNINKLRAIKIAPIIKTIYTNTFQIC